MRTYVMGLNDAFSKEFWKKLVVGTHKCFATY